NQRGDIMAGNNLWMQRDAAGNANSQVVNTSGNIETQNGNITVKTERLINQWLSITKGETQKEDIKNTFPEYAWSIPGTVNIPLSFFSADEVRYVNVSKPLDFGM
ncbi:hypothetical protein, partial [Raoultella ornithinolytica]|uniref:hypothetical protein n=1 Tax=Raoultella ornithinolytica TaxID=54291 RepID=UPI003F1A124A